MPTPLENALSQLPVLLSPEDARRLPSLLGRLAARQEAYEAQAVALELREFVHSQQGPAFGFTLTIDDEDGVYFLYTQGADGVEVDEDDFENEDAQWEYREKINEALEQMAQELNDSPWRSNKFTAMLVSRLNKIGWDKTQMDQVIQETMDKAELDCSGGAFITSLAATALDAGTPAARPQKARRGARL